jgi:hypothetical protein
VIQQEGGDGCNKEWAGILPRPRGQSRTTSSDIQPLVQKKKKKNKKINAKIRTKIKHNNSSTFPVLPFF